MEIKPVVFLLPPQCTMVELFRYMKRNDYNRYREIEPAAGSRRFETWKESANEKVD